MAWTHRAILLIILLPCVGRTGLSAADEFIQNQKAFLRELYQQKRYFDCIAETRRLLVHKPGLERADDYLYFIEANYFLGEQYRTVIDRLSADPEAGKADSRRLFLLSQSYYRLGLYGESLRALRVMDYAVAGEAERSELFLRRMQTYLADSRYADSLAEIRTLRDHGIRAAHIAEMERDIGRYRELGLRSRELSLLMSAVLPGAGQVYAGRTWDGVLSLLATGACAFGAWQFHLHGDRSMALTLGFFTGLFYAGNMYGAWNSADRTNRGLDRDFRNGLIKTYIPEYHPVKNSDRERILR